MRTLSPIRTSASPPQIGAVAAGRRARGRRPVAQLASLATLVTAAALVMVGLAVPGFTDRSQAPVAEVSPAAETPIAVPPTSEPPQPTEEPPPVLQMPGPVPSKGEGTFDYGTTQGEVAGTAGTLRRYRIAVEKGADEDVEAFGATVDAVLANKGSWIGSGRLRLQRVPDRAGHDFTVYLVTAQTAYTMCQAGWVDIRVDGKPYTSCRAQGKVILNLDRWRTSVPHYVEAEVPLDVYRDYVVNHEVGHELGYNHERCPGQGRPAPVMMQQTLFLNGCEANPWPFLDGKRYAGPPL
ncbi:DUF3152 domain-containing protein [Polymorphospora rubra]|uniref:DUF3152 domain-containing protein n=1 Tax=Polymorphospora rubra TaxID=338584 RepID=A0A810MZ34_9ACTN|nr:DUF3152 domain-containing protein [Polymorphospora rubra]BCJ64638.1 hypothetical protein Prubr_16590 [Polymorphospora rubra]